VKNTKQTPKKVVTRKAPVKKGKPGTKKAAKK